MRQWRTYVYAKKDTRALKWAHERTLALINTATTMHVRTQTHFVQRVAEAQRLHARLQLRHESFRDIFLGNVMRTVHMLGHGARSI